MQKKPFLLLLITFFLAPLSRFFSIDDVLAQQTPAHHVCGISEQDSRIIYNSMMEARQRNPNPAPMRAVAYVPVWFHLVANSDGTGRVPMNKILDMLCELNRLYSSNSIELQFYIKGINNLNNSSLYTSPRSFGGDNAIRANKKNDGVNIYMVSNANDPAQPNATVLGYYLNTGNGLPYEADWLVVINSQASIGGAVTLAHELGHFFSLPHTFLGWESCPFQPTSANPCAPATISCFGGGVYTVENAARTGTDANCSTAGDGFCDTPPDYNLGFYATSCTYNGLASDPKCVKIDPEEKNIMSYFTGCETSFSAMQKTAIQNNYLTHTNRGYLRVGNIAPTVTTLDAVNPTSPILGATTQYYNNFTLTWDAVTGATGYVVEISKTATFLDSRIFVATTNSININNAMAPNYFLTAGQNYFWRVKPYNNYVSCAAVSARQAFVAGLVNATQEIAEVTSFEVAPNPLSKTQPLQLHLTTEKAFDAQVKLFNVAGKQILSEKRHFDQGFSSQSLSISDIAAGLYILSIESEKGVLNKKVVINP
ncbi:MAG: zinc-dependent metalloprotease [Saprospiraceae bacterium]|nr:zinc-dependent metalloprotease [Saprospiraceae bacterium]